MIIRNITLENFRKFEKQSFRFNSRFNVLVGENASGKTQILDAISIAVSPYLLKTGVLAAREIIENDIRLLHMEIEESSTYEEVFPVAITAQMHFRDSLIYLKAEFDVNSNGTNWDSSSDLSMIGLQDRESIAKEPNLELPLLTYFGTNRLCSSQKEQDKETSQSRFEGYRDCLNPNSNHRDFIKWFYNQEIVALQKKTTLPILEIVRKAVINSIPKCNHIYYDMQYEKLFVVFDKGESSPFDNLSDGFKSMIAMVADIAHRAARLNPHYGNQVLEKTTGIVLIDDIDLHLHPKWQRRVVGDLKTIFPGIQFIASTHSPFIIQSLEHGEVIDLSNLSDFCETCVRDGDEEIASPPPNKEYVNRSIEDIVEEIMGIEVPQRSERYQVMYETATRYYSLLEKAEKADEREKIKLKEELDKLSAPFSDNVAFYAFLEMERLAKGLGKSKNNDDKSYATNGELE